MPFLTKSKIRQSRQASNVPKSVEPAEKVIIDDEQNDAIKADAKVKDPDKLQSLLETKKNLEKTLAEREETLRRLKLVKSYKSRKDIQNLDEAIQKWKSVSENVLNDLFDHYKASVASSSSSSNPEDLNMTMTVFLERMKVDPKLVGFDCENDCFQE